MQARPYNPSVRIGNWNEDVQLEEVSRSVEKIEKYVYPYYRYVSGFPERLFIQARTWRALDTKAWEI